MGSMGSSVSAANADELGLVPLTDSSAEFGSVFSIIPGGYDAYVRVLHPPETPEGALETWEAVARRSGAVPHALMQWHAISSSAHETTLGPPQLGGMPASTLAALIEVLQTESVDTDCQVLAAYWDGYAWLGRPPALDLSSVTKGRSAIKRIPLAGPSVELIPSRKFYLVQAPLGELMHIGHSESADWFIAESPNLIFPTDKKWLVSSEIDFDSTIVGCSSRLADALLAHPDLETWPVAGGDSLAFDGDTVNC
ncbi:hypothetical protein SAMN05428965_0301 [Geodermatophilus sp. DSM 45219]|nr:hypothetical protein SAMN05428965_0301 [Geodermatophilus sp. DSM 45219]